jgi:putative oxidoreductase
MTMAASSSGTAVEAGKLLVRLTLGVLILFHGISKVVGGAAMIVGLVEKAGLPAPFGYLVYVGEVLAPLLLIAGLWTRAAAAIVAINMVVAVYLVHLGDLFSMSKSGGWALELQGFYLFIALAVMLLGAGRFSIGGAGGRLN